MSCAVGLGGMRDPGRTGTTATLRPPRGRTRVHGQGQLRDGYRRRRVFSQAAAAPARGAPRSCASPARASGRRAPRAAAVPHTDARAGPMHVAIDLPPAVSGRRADLVVGETGDVEREDPDLLWSQVRDLRERLVHVDGELGVDSLVDVASRRVDGVVVERGDSQLPVATCWSR